MIYLIPAVLLLAAVFSPAAFAQEIKTVKGVPYGHAGGHDLFMYVTEVDDGGDFKPAMVCIHGGGWVAGEPEGMLGWAEEMAKIGFKCFTIQYRLTGEAKWPAQIEDCKQAVRHIRANARKYGVNPNRIGAFGHSAGGHISCMLGTLKPGEFEGEEHPAVSSQVQGVVNYCGPENMAAFMSDGLYDNLFGGAPEGSNRTSEADPLAHVSRASAPHILIHGTADDLVPYQPSESYRDKLRECGVRCDWLLVEGGWHIIDNYDVWPEIRKFCREVFFK